MYSQLTKSQILGRLFSSTSQYTLGTILVRAGGLLLFPLYWRKLTPSEYGIIGLTQMVSLFLAPVLSLGLFDAVQRLYFEWEPEKRGHYLSALWSTSTIFSLLFCLVLDSSGEALFSHIFTQIPYQPYIRVTLWNAFFANFSLIPLILMRIREQLKQYLFVTVTSFFTGSCLSLFCVLNLELGAFGYLLGNLINSTLWSTYLIGFMSREMRFPPRIQYLKEPLRYCLPTLPSAILEGTGSVFDRYFLDKYAGLASIGLYNLGNQFGSALNFVNQTLKFSWIPLSYRVVSERSDGPSLLSRLSIYYIAALSIPAMGIILLSKELIVWFGGNRYMGVYAFVPCFVLIYFIQGVGTAIGRGLDLSKKTEYSPIIPSVALIVNFVGMKFLIPPFGVWGAVMAFLITTTIRISVHIGLAHYFYPRPSAWGDLAKLTTIAGVACWIGSHIHTGSSLWDALVKTLILAAASLTILIYADKERAIITYFLKTNSDITIPSLKEKALASKLK